MAKKRERHQNPQPIFTEENEDSVSWKKRSKSREGRKQHHMEEKLLSSSTSSKILKEALVQQREVEDEEVHAHNPNNSLLNIVAQEPLQDHDNIDNFHGLFDEAQCSYDHNYPDIDEAEEKLLEAFLSKEGVPQRTLADIIVAKIKEKDANISSEVRPLPKLDTSIIEFYKGYG